MKKTLNHITFFLIILSVLISATLFIETIKGNALDTYAVIAIITLIVCAPTSYWLTYHKGRYDERNRQRERIVSVIKKYQ